MFGSLDNNSVTSGNGGANLPCPHEQWEVPWDDLSADTNLCTLVRWILGDFRGGETYGLLADVVEGIGGGVNNLALDLVGPTTIVSQATSASSDIDVLGHVVGLAVVQSLNSSQEFSILLEELSKLDKELATVLWGLFPPWSIESFAGGSNSDVDVLLRGLLNSANDLLGGRVDDVECLTV